MLFNLKKHAEKIHEKMLEEQHDELGQDKTIGTTNSLLEKERKNKDNSLIEEELKSVREGDKKGTLEAQLDKYDPGEGLSKRTGEDKFDQLPINLLEEKRHQEFAKSYQKAQDTDSDTAFWDNFLIQDDKAPSQLHNHHGRFKNLSEEDILKNDGVKQMVMASLADADAMVYYLFRVAADEGRELNDSEKLMLQRLSSEKAEILAKLNA